MATTDMIKKDMQNKVADKQPISIQGYIKAYTKEFAKALPSVMTAERFARIALTTITQNPKLAQCRVESFMGALLNAAQLGLEPNTPLGQAYLIPYKDTCQFQIGYRGLMDLAHRSGEIKNIEAHVVYENDEFEFEFGLDSKLKHKPTMNDKGAPQWVYAVYRLVNGGYGFEVMSYSEVTAHGKKYSKTFKDGPWQTEPEEMAKKTVLKKVLKYAPLKSDFIKGAANDETISKTEIVGDTVVTIKDETIDADFMMVDEKTGEVVDNAE